MGIAQDAGAVVLRHHERGTASVSHKSLIDLVTTADKASEALVLKALRKHFPEHDVLAEESGAHGATARYRWLIDPLDGTTNFAHGLPHFCVLIALQDAKGAYLTGWRAVQVGETWTFGGAPSSPAARPLAQNFDGIGAAGFMGGSAEAAAPVEQPKKEGDSADAGEKAEEGGGGGGGGGEDPGRRKSTPAGPIRIPGGGG